MIARYQEAALRQAFAQFPAVVLTGARQVGKTTLARWLLPDADFVSLDDPARAEQARLNPAALLDGLNRPAIIDEVQYVPGLFQHVKRAIDADRRPGAFLITGSQSFPLMAGVSESLAGRAAIFTLPGLCLGEIFSQPSIADHDAFLWRSGFPELWQRRDLDRALWLGSYTATYLERDVRQVLNVGDLRDFDRFVRASALRAGQLLSYSDLARDVGIAPNTARRWMSVLEASQQIFLLEPYHRQRTKRLIKTPKLYFADTGLLCSVLGFRDASELRQHALWGAVWENFVVSEVRKRLLATGRPPALWFWRTANGDQVDLLIEEAPEQFTAIECKTAERVRAADARGFAKLTAEYGEPSLRRGRVACRTARAYPLDAAGDIVAMPPSDLLDEVAADKPPRF